MPVIQYLHTTTNQKYVVVTEEDQERRFGGGGGVRGKGNTIVFRAIELEGGKKIK
jgi:hypothetical protein